MLYFGIHVYYKNITWSSTMMSVADHVKMSGYVVHHCGGKMVHTERVVVVKIIIVKKIIITIGTKKNQKNIPTRYYV